MSDPLPPDAEIDEEKLLDRAADERPGDRDRRFVYPRERRFIDKLLGEAEGNPRLAAKMSGYDEDHGAELLLRPQIQSELARLAELAKDRLGFDLSKDRLLQELDNALLEAKAGFSRVVTAYGTCPSCERRVSVTIQAGPKEVAALAVATSRAVETAAKIVGALAPSKVEHTSKGEGHGTYHTLVRMIRENPKALTAQQREQMIVNARKDQGDITELLRLLEAEEVTH